MRRLVVLIVFFSTIFAQAEELSLAGYMKQVRQGNGAVKGAIESSHAAKEKGRERELAFSPNLFANAQWMGDSKLPQMPFFTYDELTIHTYQLGISKLTSFGLQAKLYYELDYTAFQNAVFPGGQPGGGNIPLTYYDARPVIELSESIWGNGFGRSARASYEMTDAQAAATSASARFQARSELSQAEAAYWRLAVAREAVVIGQRQIGDAEKIHDYTARRAKMHLGETADELQSRAALDLRRLDLKSAEDEERAAARALNALRNVSSAKVSESLAPLASATLQSYQSPARAAMRDDVEAAKETQRTTAAAAELTVEKDKPTLDVYASYALNGRDTTIAPALGDSYTAGRPTKMLGVKLVVPLDLNAASDARRGAIHERDSAQMIYEQKVKDQETSWEDLNRKLGEAKERLTLSETIEKAQEAKLLHERNRLKNGRTTTYQVLLFEQDFAQSQLARLRAEADVLGLLTQMKLYSGGEL
jgi:outer membrane protein TolC